MKNTITIKSRYDIRSILDRCRPYLESGDWKVDRPVWATWLWPLTPFRARLRRTTPAMNAMLAVDDWFNVRLWFRTRAGIRARHGCRGVITAIGLWIRKSEHGARFQSME